MKPQLENGYLKIANELFEALLKTNLGGYERRVFDAILRKTYGYNKKDDFIALSQIEQLTNISKPHISRALSKLISYNMVTKIGNPTKIGNRLSVNKDFLTWSVTKIGKGGKVLPKQATTLTKIGNKVLPKQAPQNTIKNNITKDILLRNSKTFGNPDINELSEYFLKVMQIPKEDCTQRQSRQYWNLLLRESKQGVSGVKWLIDTARRDEFLSPNITSSKDLYYKRVKLISRKRGTAPKVAVFGGNHE